MKQIIKITLVILVIVFLFGCANNITDIKNEKFIDKTVTVKGEAIGVIKIGSLSGFTLKDTKTNATIPVSSDELPKEGNKVTVKGILLKDKIFQYYIKAEKVK